MTTILPPICMGCTRRALTGYTCMAYPEGIPEEILHGPIDHRQPYRGDHDLQFDPVDADAQAYAAWRFGAWAQTVRAQPATIPASADPVIKGDGIGAQETGTSQLGPSQHARTCACGHAGLDHAGLTDACYQCDCEGFHR